MFTGSPPPLLIALSLVVEGLKMDLLMDLGRWPRAELETLVRVPENEITSYNIATNGWAGAYSDPLRARAHTHTRTCNQGDLIISFA